MPPDDVVQIERELGITAPGDYRTLVTNYPPDLHEHAADFELMDEPGRVIEMNREVREGAFYGITWPPNYFAIGEDGCGSYYCLDLSKSASPVLLFDHETRSFGEQARSLQEWWPMVLKEYQDS